MKKLDGSFRIWLTEEFWCGGGQEEREGDLEGYRRTRGVVKTMVLESKNKAMRCTEEWVRLEGGRRSRKILSVRFEGDSGLWRMRLKIG